MMPPTGPPEQQQRLHLPPPCLRRPLSPPPGPLMPQRHIRSPRLAASDVAEHTLGKRPPSIQAPQAGSRQQTLWRPTPASVYLRPRSSGAPLDQHPSLEQ